MKEARLTYAQSSKYGRFCEQHLQYLKYTQYILYRHLESFLHQEKIREEAKEGWEYARLWGSKFHFKQRKIDLVRRRLWLRKMVTSNPDAEPIFTFTEDLHLSNENLDQSGQKAGQIPAFYSPRMYITYRGEELE